MASGRRGFAAVLLIAHAAILIYLTLVLNFSLGPGMPMNLVPFAMIAHDIHHGGRDLLVNFLGNVAAFVPLGFLLPVAIGPRRAAWRVATVALVFSTSIEVGQWFTGRRVTDVDDVILNTSGAMIGCGIWACWRRLTRPETDRTQKA